MKKLLLIMGILFSLPTMPAFAGKSTDKATVHRKSNTTIGNSIERAPAQLPSIDIVYDSDNLTIDILSSNDCEASVFVYDVHGNLVDSADSIYAILSIPESITPGSISASNPIAGTLLDILRFDDSFIMFRRSLNPY
ncbi:MAG: hypothetical protein K1W02_01850 [Muribaculaceae bacterium]|jgi:hypothetical protein